MALQAEETQLSALQHPWVDGAVRLMADGATLQPHRRVFEDKGPSLVAMAFQTGQVIAGVRDHHFPR